MNLAVIFLYLNFGLNLTNALSPTLAVTAGTLTVNLSNFRNDKGNAVVILFYGEKGFPKSPDKAMKILFVPIKGKRATAVFDNLRAGEYGISVDHDENNNRKLDTNFLGIPKEGVGASNNARGHFGPPKYSDAKFNFNGENLTINIGINYL